MHIHSSTTAVLTANQGSSALKLELTKRLRNDREKWWPKRSSGLESAGYPGKCQELFDVIHFTCAKWCGFVRQSVEPLECLFVVLVDDSKDKLYNLVTLALMKRHETSGQDSFPSECVR